MEDCSKHKKEVAGISDMKTLAEMIGDLHYESLKEFLRELSAKLKEDAYKDLSGNRGKLSHKLLSASDAIAAAFVEIYWAFEISKPFMKSK